MKVLLINTSDTGGAAIAIKRIHLQLLEKGVDSKLLLLKKTENIDQSYCFQPEIADETFPEVKVTYWQKIKTRIDNEINKKSKESHKRLRQLEEDKRRLEQEKLNKIISKVEAFTHPITPYDITEDPLYKEADIIQLNWVSGFLDEPTFFKKNKKPVIWRMPDLYPCGSGYHYEKYFLFDELHDELTKNYKSREEALKDANITFVCISEWQKEKANKSELIKNFDKLVIHNGVNLSTFKPINKKEARRLFNLRQDKKVILFGAESVNHKRKGYDLLLDSLKLLNIENTIFCTFGNNDRNTEMEIINFGQISDERLLCLLYSTADLFVMPSVEEAFGQVTIEALACGIPVVSFPNGGSLDIIVNYFNGIIANDFTSESLAQVIEKGLNFNFNRHAIREDVEKRFDIKDKVNEYIQLYESLLETSA